MWHFQGMQKVRQTVFFAARFIAPREGYHDASMRRGLWLFVPMAAGPSSNPGIAAGFAMEDDANRSKAAPVIGRGPSYAESIDAGGAAGSRRVAQNTTATAGKGEAAILYTVAIERSDPRLAGLMLRCEQQGSEAVGVVVEPFPPQARPQIILPTPGQESTLLGSVSV
jgi:hypothetical protein